MTEISTLEIANIAKLARLAIPEDELPVFASELSKIFNYVESLNSINTDNIKPLAQPSGGLSETPLRADELNDLSKNIIDKMIKIAPQMEGNFFKVPKMAD
jgi:aspartyl-tRNA(Asn)/glutamyl-tRNA(Gln) amidotransferase subunit C